MFSQWNFSWSMGEGFGSAALLFVRKVFHLYNSSHFLSEKLRLGCLFDVFTGLWLSTPTFCIKGYDYVKRFVRVLVLLVINTGFPKNCQKKKNREHYIVDFQFNLC